MSLSDNFIKVLVRNDLHSAPLSLQEETIEKLLLHKKLLTKRKLSSILSTIKQKYENAKVEEGDAVGIIAAQSMGEPSTQIILRTFHYAGVAVGLVTGGLSRLEEIVNATKNIKESTMTIYIDKRHNIFNILPKVQKLHKIKFARVYGRHDEQIITTQGSNLFEVLNIKGINKKKTSTNDIRETENILGIEAARESIIQQIKGIYEEQNLDIDIRHIILLADMMTCNGIVESIGRIGIMKHKKSPLARACYEEAISNLYNASIYSEFEPFDGIIENVLPGCLVNIGTGRRDICLCLNSYGKNEKRGRKKKVL